MMRPLLAAVCLAGALGVHAQGAAKWADPAKVLRVAISIAETGFDPQAAQDLYSNTINSAIFDPLYEYDYLARPHRIVPRTAEALPEISADGLTWKIRIRKGIYFADDPAFKGVKRELTAHDYVYSLKRLVDPKVRSPNVFILRGKLVGLTEAVAKAGGKLDYDAEIEGLRALDRYTLQLKFVETDYTFLPALTATQTAAVAREVIEAYGDASGWAMANPVGTGAFKLKEWRRGQRIVLEANPNYREELFPALPANPDAEARAAFAAMKGKRLPQVGRVEVSVIEESNPRLLAFNSRALDMVDVPRDLVSRALDDQNRLLPAYAKRWRHVAARVGSRARLLRVLQHERPGGRRLYARPHRVAPRIADGLQRRRHDQGRPAGPGHDREPADSARGAGARRRHQEQHAVRSRAGAHAARQVRLQGPRRRRVSRAARRQAADAGDGLRAHRREPHSRRAVVEEHARHRHPDRVSSIRSGRTSSRCRAPDSCRCGKSAGRATSADSFMELAYGPNGGESNLSFFKNAEYDDLFRQSRKVKTDAERDKLYARMTEIVAAYAPMGGGIYRIENTLSQPWIKGYKKDSFRSPPWRFVDIDRAGVKAGM